jgi:DNA-binding MarR family transcriptional regulator
MPSIGNRQHAVKRLKTPRRTPAGDALTELIIPAIRLRALFTTAGEALARPAGQSLARWLVLEVVADGPATVAQIARNMGLARQSVQRVADLLEQDGLTAYAANPGHRRAQLVRVTARGLRTLRTIQATQRVWADAVGAEIGEEDLRKTLDVVGRLLRVLTARRHLGSEKRANHTTGRLEE